MNVSYIKKWNFPLSSNLWNRKSTVFWGGSSWTLDPCPSTQAPSPSPLHLPCCWQIFHVCFLAGSPFLEWNTRRKKKRHGGQCSGPWSPCIRPMLAMSTTTFSPFWKSIAASAKITFPSSKRFLSFCRVSAHLGQKIGGWGWKGEEKEI